MKPLLILSLAIVPLLGACANAAQHVLAAPVQVKPQPRAAEVAQPGQDPAWADAVASAKLAGSLYRSGAFFPHAPAPAAGDAAAALP